MCMADGGDLPEFYRKTLCVARREHKCAECTRIICPGENYQSVFGVFEGATFTSKTCSHCLVAQSWLAKNCGGWLHGAMIDDIKEHIAEYPDIGFGLARLVVGARRRWRSFSDPSRLLPVQAMPHSIESFVNA